jgi:serine phosphatase RsbU (regulator of sigma subunit)/PAS domain-containing protein
VAYTTTTKRVWFVLPLPGSGARDVTDLAAPLAAASALPEAPGDVRVAVVHLTADGRVATWGADATALLGWESGDVEGRSWPQLVVRADGSGPMPVDELLGLARWQGTYAVRLPAGGVRPVFASHIATTVHTGVGTAVHTGVDTAVHTGVDTAVHTGVDDTTHSVLCLLVDVRHRALLAAEPGVDRSLPAARDDVDDVGLSDALTVRLELDDLLQRTVERARDILLGDAAYVLLTAEDAEEIELRATTGLPTTLPRYVRLPAEHGAVGRFSSDRLPAVHDDLGAAAEAMPLLADTGMRSLVTVPMLVEGRVVGTLGVAARRVGRFDNDSAVRLQRAADRVALAVQTARLVELERQRRGWLTFLAEASDLLAGTLDLDMTLALVGQLVVPRLATWCAVHITDDAGVSQLAYVWHMAEDRTDDLRALLQKVPAPQPAAARSAMPWAPATGIDLAGTELARAADLATDVAVAIPLLARGRSLGTLSLGKPGNERFRRDVLDLAEDLARRSALALDNARVYRDRAETAQALQRSLLPPELPDVPGVDVGVAYEAAGAGNEVGGDFYDVFATDEHRWGFAVGDVCGKGAEAAAVTGLARHALRILGRESHSVAGVVQRLNREILDEGPRSRFLTAVSGQIMPLSGGGVRVSFVCAGHPLPLLLREDGSVTAVGTPQPLLGVLDEVEFGTDVIELGPGDVLVCVTDGVTERRDGARMLGEEGLAAVVSTCTGLSAAAVAARIQREVMSFGSAAPRDDMAILVLRAT